MRPSGPPFPWIPPQVYRYTEQRINMKRYLAGGLLACSWLTVAGAQSMPPLNWKPVLHPVVPAKGAIQVVFAEPGPPEPWVATVLVDRNADKAQCGAGFAIVDGVWVSRMEDLPAKIGRASCRERV